MNIRYKFYNSTTKYGTTFNIISVEEPYDHMSTMFEGNETSQEIAELIDEAEKIINGELDKGGIANNAGFDSFAYPPSEDYPEGGVDIYDYFDENYGEEPIYTISLADYLQILKDFKKFLEEHGR